MTQKTTFEDIKEAIGDWQGNIECDIRNTDTPDTKKWEYMLQSSQLSMILGLLDRLGHNPNIVYDKN